MRMKKLVKYIDNCWDCPYFMIEYWGRHFCMNSNFTITGNNDNYGFIEPPEWCEFEDVKTYGD